MEVLSFDLNAVFQPLYPSTKLQNSEGEEKKVKQFCSSKEHVEIVSCSVLHLLPFESMCAFRLVTRLSGDQDVQQSYHW